MSDLLDRPVWHALTSCHAQFAVGGAAARRYAPDVSPFAAAREDSAESIAQLGRLVAPGEPIILLQATASPVPPGTAQHLLADGVQMIAGKVAPPSGTLSIDRLSTADVPEMTSLADLTKPGPFSMRTHELGSFFGIRANGRVVSMAGERFRLPGFTEISAVCTHPDFSGRGYASVLSRFMAHRIQSRGDTPFLHAWASNSIAIRLYERLGFELRRAVVVQVFKPAAVE